MDAITRPAAPPTAAAPQPGPPPVQAFDPLLGDGPERYVEYGATVAARGKTAPPPKIDGRPVTLNFPNAPLRAVLDATLGEILQVPYVIDPGADKTISLQTSEDLPRAAVLPALERALEFSGLTLYTDNSGVYHIGPRDAVAGTASLNAIDAGQTRAPGYGVSVIALRYGSAGNLGEVLRPLVGNAASLHFDKEHNLVVVAGPGPVRESVRDMVATLDVDEMARASIGLFPLEAAEASAVAKELDGIFHARAGSNPQLQFIPVARLNSILVITPAPAQLARAERWIKRLDRASAGEDGRSLQVYRLQNVRAVEIAESLGQLFGARRESRAFANTNQLASGFEPVQLDTAPAGGQMSSGGNNASTPNADERDRSALERSSTYSAEGGLKLTADAGNNALIVLGTESDHRRIRSALRELDVRPLQVLIEATIAEVSLNDELRFGLQWFFKDGKHKVTLSSFASGAVAEIFPGFSYVFEETGDARVVLDALDEVTNVRVISSPQLMVLNNQSAELQVGDQVPVATRSAIGVANPDAPIVNTIEFKDTGVILSVTPRVNNGGLVLLDIEQEVSTVVATTTSGIDSPTIQRRRVRSRVAVESGETVALGGLIQDTKSQGESGVPGLSRIPLLGNLFKSNHDIDDRTELLILLTPRVIASLTDARAITDELKARLTSRNKVETGFH